MKIDKTQRHGYDFIKTNVTTSVSYAMPVPPQSIGFILVKYIASSDAYYSIVPYSNRTDTFVKLTTPLHTESIAGSTVTLTYTGTGGTVNFNLSANPDNGTLYVEFICL